MDRPSYDRIAKDQKCFTGLSPKCCFNPKGVNKFVFKPSKWVTNSKVLAEALDRRCSNSSEPSAHAPDLVNTVLRALRQQMDGSLSWSCSPQVPSPSESVFDVQESAASQWADEFDDLTGAWPPGELVRAGKIEEIRWVTEIKLYKKISRSEAKLRGIAVVPIMWVVTDKRSPR